MMPSNTKDYVFLEEGSLDPRRNGYYPRRDSPNSSISLTFYRLRGAIASVDLLLPATEDVTCNDTMQL